MLPTLTSNRMSQPALARDRFTTGLSELIDNFFGRPFGAWEAWSPPADLTETDEAFVLEMDLPGLERENVELTVDQGVLTVHATQPDRSKEEATYLLRERVPGTFTRSFRLPSSVDREAVDAKLRNGLLRVTLPKMAEAKPRRIAVSG